MYAIITHVEHVEVDIFVIRTERVFLRITWWKNFENRSTFAKVIIKHRVVYFFGTRCIIFLLPGYVSI